MGIRSGRITAFFRSIASAKMGGEAKLVQRGTIRARIFTVGRGGKGKGINGHVGTRYFRFEKITNTRTGTPTDTAAFPREIFCECRRPQGSSESNPRVTRQGIRSKNLIQSPVVNLHQGLIDLKLIFKCDCDRDEKNLFKVWLKNKNQSVVEIF